MMSANLLAEYQAAWGRFSLRTNEWQSLQADPGADILGILKAETAARFAEEQYRQARNALAEYLLEISSRTHQLVAC